MTVDLEKVRVDIDDCAELEAVNGLREIAIQLADEVERIRKVLDKLARLGNEPNFGNSIGNRIAYDALPTPADKR